MLYFYFIEQALTLASYISNKYFGKVKGTSKTLDNNQVLSEADIAIGEMIIKKIGNDYPQYNIIDEEKGAIDKNSEYTWVIDPVDGTSNFVYKVPLYGTFLGLLKGDIPIAGGMVLPYFNEIYLAEKNSGTWLNAHKLKVSEEKMLKKSLISYTIDSRIETPNFTRKEAKILAEIILKIRNPRMAGSCFDTAMVARGSYQAYINQTSKIWDNVAAEIIIEEAGGVYTDFYGKKMDYSNPLSRLKDNYTFCAAAPAIHKKLQKIIYKYK